MFRFLIFLGYLLIIARATKVKRCGPNIPFPLDVRVKGCEVPPCDIIKGKSVEFEVHFVADKFITKGTTLVKAKALGLTVPYELPDDVRDVCSNLTDEAMCPLYPTEDATYSFAFPIANTYPEIGVNVQIYIVDQDGDMVTCYKCDIKVKKGSTANSTSTLQLSWFDKIFGDKNYFQNPLL